MAKIYLPSGGEIALALREPNLLVNEKPAGNVRLRRNHIKPTWAWLNVAPFARLREIAYGDTLSVSGSTYVLDHRGFVGTGANVADALKVIAMPSGHPMRMGGQEGTLIIKFSDTGGGTDSYPRVLEIATGGSGASGYAIYRNDSAVEFANRRTGSLSTEVKASISSTSVSDDILLIYRKQYTTTGGGKNIFHLDVCGSDRVWATSKTGEIAPLGETTEDDLVIGNANGWDNKFWTGTIKGIAFFSDYIETQEARHIAENFWRYLLEPANQTPYIINTAATGGATEVTLTPDSLAITEGTLSVEVSTEVTLNADALVITEPGVTVDVATDVAVTLSPDTLAITEPGVGVSYNVDITPIADSLILSEPGLSIDYNVAVSLNSATLTISEPGVSIAYDVSVTPSADALTITEPGLDVTASIEVNTNADSLVLTEGSLSIDVGNDVTVSLSSDSLVLTAGPLTVQADVDTLVTLVNDTLTITEPGLTVQADVDVAVTLNADTLTITDGSLGVAVDVIATLVPDSLVITEPGINVTIGGDVDVTLSADSLTLSEGTLTITASSLVTLEMVYNKLLEIEALLANHAGPIGATEEVILTKDYAQVGLYFDGSQYQVF